jgi:predicted acetyltransferase
MSSAIVRAPKQDEIWRAAEIGQIAFGTETIESWLRSFTWVADNAGLEYLVVAETENQIAASLICTPGTARFGNDIVPFSAVGAVGTHPDYRQHGLAGLMMQESVKMLYRNGYCASALWPFSYKYYRKFGWELGGEQRKYIVPADVAAGLATSDNVRPALKADLPGINDLITRFSRHYTCITTRDEAWWDCILTIYDFKLGGEDDPTANPGPWIHETNGIIDAYAFIIISGEGDGKKISIRELVADNPRARQAILSRLTALELPIEFFAPINDDFLQELPDPRAITCHLEPSFQFRVINPPAALELRTTDSEFKCHLGFSISDPVLGMFDFDIEADNGKLKMVKSRAKERLSIDVQVFSQLYSGYIRPMRSVELGKLEATSPKAIELAEQLFPTVTPYRSPLELG